MRTKAEPLREAIELAFGIVTRLTAARQIVDSLAHCAKPLA